MKYKILSGNCWQSPFLISFARKKRMVKLINLIKKTNPDFVLLQEIWMKKDLKKLKREFPSYNFYTSNSGFFMNTSGLVVLSKVKGESFYKTFSLPKISKINEIIEHKGFHVLKTKDLDLINVHMIAPWKVKKTKHCELQFEEVLEAFKDLKEETIISGDFNISPEELLKTNDKFNVSDNGKTFCPSKNPYANRRIQRVVFGKEEDKKIDYLLTHKNSRLKVSSRNLPDTISDHYFVMHEVEF